MSSTLSLWGLAFVLTGCLSVRPVRVEPIEITLSD
jgi:hypothetical protein